MPQNRQGARAESDSDDRLADGTLRGRYPVLSMMRCMSGPVSSVTKGLLGRYLSRLRFPQLFMIAAILFVVDVIVPDVIPFADEILLFLVTLMLGSLKRPAEPERPPEKNVTPPNPPPR